jgi:hypothetical protein
VGSRRGRSEGAELEGENKRGGGVEGLKPMCGCDGGVGWLCGKKTFLPSKIFSPSISAPSLLPLPSPHRVGRVLSVTPVVGIGTPPPL